MSKEQQRLDEALGFAITTSDQVLELGKVAAVVEIDTPGEPRKRAGPWLSAVYHFRACKRY